MQCLILSTVSSEVSWIARLFCIVSSDDGGSKTQDSGDVPKTLGQGEMLKKNSLKTEDLGYLPKMCGLLNSPKMIITERFNGMQDQGHNRRGLKKTFWTFGSRKQLSQLGDWSQTMEEARPKTREIYRRHSAKERCWSTATKLEVPHTHRY